MKILKYVCICLIVGLFSPLQFIYADQCDDIYQTAKRIYESAKEAAGQKNYNLAVELLHEAEEYYDQVANMEGCRCPKISEASQKNATLCRERADKYQEFMHNYESEMRLYDDYNQAKELYNQGNAYARKKEWDKAIAAFEEAAEIWESVGASTQSENGRRALKSAKQARDAASLARKYKQRQ